MNELENRLLSILRDLKENFHVIGVKAEFEAEGTKLEEAYRLKELVSKANIGFTIKIGGCEAIKEMYEAKAIGVNSLVAPMIETPYALKKYSNAVKKVFSKSDNVKFYANIETITGYNNLDAMINSSNFEILSGIVLGRDDMTGSMDLPTSEVESLQIFDLTNSMAQKMQQIQKEFVVGGSISKKSIPTFKRLPQKSLTKFETRKIIFDANAVKLENINDGLVKAIEFELLWLKNKREAYKILLEEDEQRLTLLQKRYNDLKEESEKSYV